MSDDKDYCLALITDEIIIKKGLDKHGCACYATKFVKTGTERDGKADLIDFVDGLGMLEAAKFDFVERWAE